MRDICHRAPKYHLNFAVSADSNNYVMMLSFLKRRDHEHRFFTQKLYTYDGTYHYVARFLINLRIQCTGAPFRIVFFFN